MLPPVARDSTTARGRSRRRRNERGSGAVDDGGNPRLGNLAIFHPLWMKLGAGDGRVIPQADLTSPVQIIRHVEVRAEGE